eukprot:TRINITY_DN1473_c1_g1_i1.p1 TRINITY_DN1473_c1_g1~~TRINITY_DN1473_c1_g1_i1.p1  ORF type:complete len:252 (+),score=50.90 TRINITY_DN1473_c1_g1_i1:3-758(+)
MPDLDLFLQPKEMLLVLSVFASGAAAAATPFSSSEQTEIVNAHNVIRRAVNPPAQTMPDLVWSSAIATDAQNWADQCNWSHSVPSGQGQNLYATSASSSTGSAAVNSWGGEKSSWVYAPSGSGDSTGGVVGHYTQIIWATTTEVGCGRTVCPSGLTGWSPGRTIVVCNYRGPGNWVGEYPYVEAPASMSQTPKPDNGPNKNGGGGSGSNSKGVAAGASIAVIAGVGIGAGVFVKKYKSSGKSSLKDFVLRK